MDAAISGRAGYGWSGSRRAPARPLLPLYHAPPSQLVQRQLYRRLICMSIWMRQPSATDRRVRGRNTLVRWMDDSAAHRRLQRHSSSRPTDWVNGILPPSEAGVRQIGMTLQRVSGASRERSSENQRARYGREFIVRCQFRSKSAVIPLDRLQSSCPCNVTADATRRKWPPDRRRLKST